MATYGTPSDADGLYREHHHALLRYLVRFTGDPDEAQDAAQEAYLRLVQQPPDDPARARAWLFSVATNVVRDRARQRRSEWLAAQLVSETAEPPPDAAAHAESAETRLAVRRMLTGLSVKQRSLLLMHAEGFTHREIAMAVGTTTRSVGTMLGRALKKIKRQMEARGEEAS